ncbi:MAG TPA: tRNA pseudouridine(38-40) synthase TruA [Candidatus Babeliales bacterium]|nr:tRNA pseudouridine(38-40) synthase TruA [Candidatus Babeliales bacterium]
MRYFKTTLTYDGTNYHGWQAQPGQATIQGTLARAFRAAFGVPWASRAASRTDAGVHALQQTISWCAPLGTLSSAKIATIWNHQLPLDIGVQTVAEVRAGYNIHTNVQEKTYYYDLFTQRPLPLYSRFGWYYGYRLDWEKLQMALQLLTGTHDFRSFCTGDERADTVRTLAQPEIVYVAERQAYRLIWRGHSFLKYMVRRLTGAVVKVASCPQLSVAQLAQVLHRCDPHHTLPTAPAHGLTLQQISYSAAEAQWFL